jgi:dihydroorotase
MISPRKLMVCPYARVVVSFLTLLFCAVLSYGQQQQVDILLKGGHVIDPKNNIDGVMDVAISEGKIFRVAQNIPVTNAKRIIDVKGYYVTPGLIDMHVHVFVGNDLESYIANGQTSVPADGLNRRQ